eukprot:153534-Amphidinium_carterae.1
MSMVACGRGLAAQHGVASRSYSCAVIPILSGAEEAHFWWSFVPCNGFLVEFTLALGKVGACRPVLADK